MATTTDGFPYPLSSEDLSDGAAAIQALAQYADDQYVADLIANRPAFGKPGRRFYATDTGDVWLDTGAAWVFLHATAACASVASAYSTSSGTHRMILSSPIDVRGPLSFSRADSNTRLVVPTNGTYLITARLDGTWSGPSAAHLTIADGNGYEHLTSTIVTDHASVSGDAVIVSGGNSGKFAVEIRGGANYTPSDLRLMVRRVGP